MKAKTQSALASVVATQVLILTLSSKFSTAFAQGSLTPPGPPAPTMKSLDEIEPRMPISSVPFIITQPGAYYLVTNLTSTGNGIVINSGGVTVDLMGFALAGGPGSTVGIAVTSGGLYTNICVRNGTIRGWNGDGLNLLAHRAVVVEHVRTVKNSGNGLSVGDGAMVKDCEASFNGIQGIVTGVGATVSGCTAFGNGNSGITMGDASLVVDATSVANGVNGLTLGAGTTARGCNISRNAVGISAEANTLIHGCAVNDNRTAGIVVGDGCVLEKCQANGNRSSFGDGVITGIRCSVKDCTTVSNSLNGIHVKGDSVVSDCHSSFNGQIAAAAGIYVEGASSRIENNDVRDNNGYGILGGTGDLILRNSSGNNTTNYFPNSGVNFGPIQAPNAATSPWANFTF